MAKVLLVEGDRDASDEVVDEFTSAGHEVTVVDNGAEAVERLRAETFDAVMTSLYTPERADTEQVIRVAREKAISIIAVNSVTPEHAGNLPEGVKVINKFDADYRAVAEEWFGQSE